MSEINIHRVFNFFQNNEENTKTTCNFCFKEYDIPLNISTAKSHISSKHPEEWKNVRLLTRKRKSIQKNINLNQENDNNNKFETQSNTSSNSFKSVKYIGKDVEISLPKEMTIEHNIE
ncbi:883_t:CDS:1 [Scutellospora calospora]|uniref:883_t:CDS:1 n=1 Tax=Scutellospora calospora TaxID=85575 RepID=A0ACA9KIW2_9GLOM|nr:883_t:CDS:1 [Scutellospora calospora]